MTMIEIRKWSERQAQLGTMTPADYLAEHNRCALAMGQPTITANDDLLDDYAEAHGDRAKRYGRIIAAIAAIPVQREYAGLVNRLEWPDNGACNAARLLIRKGGEVAARTRDYLRLRYDRVRRASDLVLDQCLLLGTGHGWGDQDFHDGPRYP
jgi:hypothetical protein